MPQLLSKCQRPRLENNDGQVGMNLNLLATTDAQAVEREEALAPYCPAEAG